MRIKGAEEGSMGGQERRLVCRNTTSSRDFDYLRGQDCFMLFACECAAKNCTTTLLFFISNVLDQYFLPIFYVCKP